MQDIPNQYQPTAQKTSGNATSSEVADAVMNLPSRGEKTRSIMLDGQAIVIPTSRSSEMETSRQTRVTGNIASTPGYFRIMMPFLMVRYTLSSIIDGFTGFNAANNLDLLGKVRDPINEWFGTKIPEISINKMVSRQTEVLKDAVNNGNNIKDAELILYKTGSLFENDAFANFKEKAVYQGTEKSDFTKFKEEDAYKAIEKKLKSNLSGKAFDIGVGAAMSIATSRYTWIVLNDIIETYAESVAHEFYKDSKDVNVFDIFKSENKIVKETRDTFVKKTAFRFGTDFLAFGRVLADINIPFIDDNLPQHFKNFTHAMQGLPFGNMAIGIKGASLVLETQRKETSFFTDLVDLIDLKVNAQKGLANPINSSDLLNLYQKYESKNDKTKMFEDITRHDTQDDDQWRTSNAIFSRMAELMNETYKYKHGFDKDLTAEEQLEKDVLSAQRSFALPKFIYLLGNDLIDLDNPEKTLAYAEVANSWSIQDVKLLRHALEVENIPLHEALRAHPVDIEATLGKRTSPELLEISELARKVDKVLIEEGITKDFAFKKKHEEVIKDKQADMKLQNAEEKTPAPERDATKELPVFFPAKTESLRHENENANPLETSASPAQNATSPTPKNSITEAEAPQKMQEETAQVTR